MLPSFRQIYTLNKYSKFGSQTSATANNNKIFTKYVRNLSVHEYLSMGLLRDYNINVPKGQVAHSAKEAYDYSSKLFGDNVKDLVIKAQVLAGGRGKGSFTSGLNSGVHMAFDAETISKLADQMIGSTLVTKQTGSKGLPCEKVYICERLYSRRDFYFAIMLDRASVGPVIIASGKGGVNIEEVAKEDPSAIYTLKIDAQKGIENSQMQQFLQQIGFTQECIPEAIEQVKNLYRLFCEKDCTLLEINPFCETNDHKVYCLDCKLQFDFNAVYRHPEIEGYIDNTQVDPREVEATKFNLNYVGLDGNIGCLVNGAGLAMSTMDIIKLNGGNPANFLDVGGGATAEQVNEAFKIITSDPNVKAILVNIFGGIMRCDVIAEGIIMAAENLNITIPIVVRLQGTRVDDAKALIASSNLKIIPVDELDAASKLVCKLAHIVEIAHEAQLNVNFELPL